MAGATPDTATLENALTLAGNAPSAGNTQPWRWHVDRDGVHLVADWERRRGDTDFDRRDVVLGCGAVLNHCVVAFAAAGWGCGVRRFPDGGVLASLAPAQRPPGAGSVELAEAIPRRRADRRPYAPGPIPAGTLELLQLRAERFGVRLAVLPRARWGRIPDADVTLGYGTTTATAPDDDAVMIVLGTDDDTDPMWLRAGEALSHLTLAAAVLGLATCPISAPLRDARSRLAVACEVFDADAHPHAMIRLGRPPVGADPLPPVERRAVAETTTWALD